MRDTNCTDEKETNSDFPAASFEDFPVKESPESGTEQHHSHVSTHTHHTPVHKKHQSAKKPSIDHSQHDHHHRGETKAKELLNDGEKAEAEGFSSAADLVGRRKKLPRWAKIVIAVCAFLAALLLVFVIIISAKLSRITYYSKGNEASLPQNGEVFITDNNPLAYPAVSPADISLSALSAEKVKGTANTLIIVTDSDASDGAGPKCILLLSRDKSNGNISLYSVLPETYVAINGYSDNQLSTAYCIRGGDLLCRTFEDNFGIQIDNYFAFDHLAVRDIADTVGGVDISINDSEAAYLENLGYRAQNGMNHLSGEAVLALARGKTDGDTPFTVSEKHLRIFASVQSAICGSLSPVKDLGIMDDLFPTAVTDMTKGELFALCRTLTKMRTGDYRFSALPTEGDCDSAYVRDMSVILIKDRSALAERLAGEISGK